MSGPTPVTCLSIASDGDARQPGEPTVPAGTRIRILSFQNFSGVDAQSTVVKARLAVDGKETDLYLDPARLEDYF